jgi:hypothetical protein
MSIDSKSIKDEHTSQLVDEPNIDDDQVASNIVRSSSSVTSRPDSASPQNMPNVTPMSNTEHGVVNTDDHVSNAADNAVNIEDHVTNSPGDVTNTDEHVHRTEDRISNTKDDTTDTRNEAVNNESYMMNKRPISPVVRHRTNHQPVHKPSHHFQRARSNSPRKTFSYLPSDRWNVRKWNDQRRQLAQKAECDRIYYENRQKLERLARIAREPSSYPTIHIRQERLRERHETDYRQKLVKNYLPILRDNLCIVNRLANVKGVYDRQRMEDDFVRHTQILRQDAANRQRAREMEAQRSFILPRIHLKS